MTDNIRGLTHRLADEPTSLAFLDLGEALRQRGQLEAAFKVARGGLTRYPGLADAHDLVARILCDQGDLAGAFDAWAAALRIDPLRSSAHKGIGFLYFRAGESAAALEHLQRAADADPDDATIARAIERARGRLRAPVQAAEDTQPTLHAAGEEGGTLLIDASGMRLSGSLAAVGGEDVSDQVAALLAGVSREASRAARLLGLGEWKSLAAESPDAHFHLSVPTTEALLLITRPATLPSARVALAAERAGQAARRSLETET